EMEAFRQDHPVTRVTAWAMPSLSEDDLSLFSVWFDKPLQRAGALERTLLIELLFTAQVGGPITRFATTFAQRLRHFGLAETALKLVALNALDIAAPDSLFQSQAERDTIERLVRSDQLHFEQKNEEWGIGIRLVHGAIAWLLFEAWSSDNLR